MSKHSIIILYNSKEKKILNYFDSEWNMYLLPSWNTVVETITNNIQMYKEEVIYNIEQLQKNVDEKFGTNKAHLTYIGSSKVEKYSRSDNINKIYHHDFYLLEDYNSINYKDYKWMTLEEMSQDKDISLYNYDIINFLKNNIKKDL